jgi:hypothetical protein
MNQMQVIIENKESQFYLAKSNLDMATASALAVKTIFLIVQH